MACEAGHALVSAFRSNAAPQMSRTADCSGHGFTPIAGHAPEPSGAEKRIDDAMIVLSQREFEDLQVLAHVIA